MINNKKIEDAAKQHSEESYISGYFQACYKDAFMEGAKWAINELLKDLWHSASEIPCEGKYLVVEYNVTDTIKDYLSFKRLEGYLGWIPYCKSANITQWLYIDDLFQKEGGEQ